MRHMKILRRCEVRTWRHSMRSTPGGWMMMSCRPPASHSCRIAAEVKWANLSWMMELFFSFHLQSFSREHEDLAALNSEQTGGSEGSGLAAGSSLPYTSTSLRSCFCSALAFQTSPRCSALTAPSQTHWGCSSQPARFQQEIQIRFIRRSEKLCLLHPSETTNRAEGGVLWEKFHMDKKIKIKIDKWFLSAVVSAAHPSPREWDQISHTVLH